MSRGKTLKAHIAPLCAALVGLLLTAGALLTDPHHALANSGFGPETQVGSVQVNNVTIAYESHGSPDRETILLIAGTGMQLTGWPDELIDELVRRGFRVVRYDNRDTGLSTIFDDAGWPDFEEIFRALGAGEPAPLPYTIDDMVQDAIGLLDTLGIDQAHIVGASMGGTIAQLVAADYPERTLSLTSMMADSGNPAIPAVGDEEALAAIPPLLPGITEDDYVERRVLAAQLMGSPSYRIDENTLRQWALRDVARSFAPAGEARQGMAVLLAHFSDRTEKLKAITAPTVILHGAEDPLVPVASAEDLAGKISGAELRIVPGMGHDFPLELVPNIADAITAAMKR
nr:Est3 [uncultured bacterium]